MGETILILVLAVLVFVLSTLHKTYQSLPAKELRRRARAGDQTASSLYKVAGYGIGFDILIWALIAASSSTLFILLNNSLSWWLAVLIIILVIWLAFAWIPHTKASAPSQKIAALLAPAIAKVLSFLVPLSSRAEIWHRRITTKHSHSGLFEKEDLLELLHAQTNQADNRISDQELTIARGALTFGDKSVAGVMTPRRVIKFVAPSDQIGPHLMDTLHKSGFSRFPVLDKPDGTEKIVGTLYLKDIVGRGEGGSVEQVMSREVYYINERQSLLQALNAFIKNKHHLFVVVNNFEEITGVLTIEDVLEQIIGSEIVDEFDEYDDLRAVASAQAQKDHKSQKHQVDQQPEPEQTEEESPQAEETVVE